VEIAKADVLLCEFYFSDLKQSKNRPVIVFKDNLPHNDFIAIPISSNIEKLYEDEIIIDNDDFQSGSIPQISKVMIRKTFVVSKKIIIKKYGTIKQQNFEKYKNKFCEYFECNK